MNEAVPRRWIRTEELDVLRLYMQGHTDRSIARRLGISQATVRRRAARARSRTGTRTRAELVAMLAVAGLLPVQRSRALDGLRASCHEASVTSPSNECPCREGNTE